MLCISVEVWRPDSRLYNIKNLWARVDGLYAVNHCWIKQKVCSSRRFVMLTVFLQ
jgi:hypothetical protein